MARDTPCSLLAWSSQSSGRQPRQREMWRGQSADCTLPARPGSDLGGSLPIKTGMAPALRAGRRTS